MPANNPKLLFLEKRLTDTLQLAAEKAAAHLSNPSAYPLPPANTRSMERALYEVAMALPKRKRDDFAEKLMTSVQGSPASRLSRFGDLAAIDLKKAMPVHEQVKAIAIPEAMKLTSDENALPDLKKFVPGALKKSKQLQPAQAVLATKLDFIVDSVTCNKTNDLKKDEIRMGAFGNDSTGASFNTDPFFVGKFKKNDSIPAGAKGNLFVFSADGGSVGGFPITYLAGLFLIEEDLIHNEELGNKLSFAFALAMPLLIAAASGALFIPGTGPTISTILFVAAGVSAFLGHYLIPAMIDDFSAVVTDTLVLEQQPLIGETISKTLEFTIPGSVAGYKKAKYTAAVRWVTS